MRVLDGIEKQVGRRLADRLFQHDRIVVQPESCERRSVDDDRQNDQRKHQRRGTAMHHGHDKRSE